MRTPVMVVLAAAFLLALTGGIHSSEKEAGDSIAPGPGLDHHIQASVLVKSSAGTGSGVVFKNGDVDLVWTAAHVLGDDQVVKTVIDPATGLPKVSITYNDVFVLQPLYEDGRKVGEVGYLARILRFSNGYIGGEDIGLLRIYKKRAFHEGVTFAPAGYIPRAGEPLWHVGSMAGTEGANTPTDGIFSVAGRLRVAYSHNEVGQPKVYDQVTLMALKGASGGGIFQKNNGHCIGILSQGLGRSIESGNLVIPSRRLHEFAKRTGCEWAVDASIPMPDAAGEGQTTDREIPLPKDWQAGFTPPKSTVPHVEVVAEPIKVPPIPLPATRQPELIKVPPVPRGS